MDVLEDKEQEQGESLSNQQDQNTDQQAQTGDHSFKPAAKQFKCDDAKLGPFWT